MKKLILIIKNIGRYKYWLMRKYGFITIDYTRGCGYYITVGLLGYNPIGQLKSLTMASGKKGIYKLIDYDTYRDPWDMVKTSQWQLLGYIDAKPINECTFEEYYNIYCGK